MEQLNETSSWLQVIKAWEEAEHPRHPAGDPLSRGGQFAPKNPAVPGYSVHAREDENGIIHTSEIDDAVKALTEGRRVQLEQVRQISVLLKKLSELAHKAEALGNEAPVYDLCNVTIKGTNLFCAEALDLKRHHMPQLLAFAKEGSIASKLPKRSSGKVDASDMFVEDLQKRGYTVTRTEESAAYLRATQRQLNGAKVGSMMEWLRQVRGTLPPMIVSDDNYIIDGHHRWAGLVGLDTENNQMGDLKLPVYRVGIKVLDLLKEANEFTDRVGLGRSRVETTMKNPWIKKVWDYVSKKFNPDQPPSDPNIHKWDESEHPRGKSTPESNSGSFKPKGAAARAELDKHIKQVAAHGWKKSPEASAYYKELRKKLKEAFSLTVLGNLPPDATDEQKKAYEDSELKKELDELIEAGDRWQEAWEDEQDKIAEERERVLEPLRKKSYKALDNLSEVETSSMMAYLMQGYVEVNFGLRGEKIPEQLVDAVKARNVNTEEVVKHMDEIVSRVTTDHDIVVYRGVRHPLPTDEGALITDLGYSSTSENTYTAEWFADDNGGVMHIKVPKGTNALFTNSVSPIRDRDGYQEDEIILPRGTTYRVIRKLPNTDDENRPQIEVEVVTAKADVTYLRDGMDEMFTPRWRKEPQKSWLQILKEWNESDHPRGKTKPGTNDGSFRPAGMPPKSGEAEIPEGAVRLYHYTESDETLKSILKEGLLQTKAKGHTYGEPSVVWASASKPGRFKPYVEIYAFPNELSIGGIPKREKFTEEELEYIYGRGSNVTFWNSVPPERIVSWHETWRSHYDYIEENSDTLEEVLAGGFDYLEEKDERYASAIKAIKEKYGVAKWDESQHPRGKTTPESNEGSFRPESSVDLAIKEAGRIVADLDKAFLAGDIKDIRNLSVITVGLIENYLESPAAQPLLDRAKEETTNTPWKKERTANYPAEYLPLLEEFHTHQVATASILRSLLNSVRAARIIQSPDSEDYKEDFKKNPADISDEFFDSLKAMAAELQVQAHGGFDELWGTMKAEDVFTPANILFYSQTKGTENSAWVNSPKQYDKYSDIEKYISFRSAAINGLLRGAVSLKDVTGESVSEEEVRENIAGMTRVIGEQPATPYNMTLYRGLYNPEKHPKFNQGDVVELAGFTSTSTASKVAHSFSSDRGPDKILVFYVPKNTKNVYVTHNYTEKEVLLNHNSVGLVVETSRMYDYILLLDKESIEKWDERAHPRGKTTPASNAGSFRPKGSAAQEVRDDIATVLRGWSKLDQPWSWEHLQHAARHVVTDGSPDDYVLYDYRGNDKELYSLAASAIAHINNQEDVTKPLYRGVHGSFLPSYKDTDDPYKDEPVREFKVGDEFSESLTSWTGKKELAQQFADDLYSSERFRSPRRGAIFILEGDGMKAIPVSPALEEASSILKDADEWLASGRYRVTRVREAEDGTRLINVTRVGNASADNLMKKEWDESEHPRGKTTPKSNSGSFAPKGTNKFSYKSFGEDVHTFAMEAYKLIGESYVDESFTDEGISRKILGLLDGFFADSRIEAYKPVLKAMRGTTPVFQSTEEGKLAARIYEDHQLKQNFVGSVKHYMLTEGSNLRGHESLDDAAAAMLLSDVYPTMVSFFDYPALVHTAYQYGDHQLEKDNMAWAFALDNYIGPWYKKINGYLRGRGATEDHVSLFAKDIHVLINNRPATDRDHVFYRGVKTGDSINWDRLQIGDKLDLAGFTSTSTQTSTSISFTSSKRRRVVFIVPEGSKDVYFTTNNREREVMLNHNISATVVRRDDQEGLLYVVMDSEGNYDAPLKIDRYPFKSKSESGWFLRNILKWNEEDHPRHPAGTSGSRGGEFRAKYKDIDDPFGAKHVTIDANDWEHAAPDKIKFFHGSVKGVVNKIKESGLLSGKRAKRRNWSESFYRGSEAREDAVFVAITKKNAKKWAITAIQNLIRRKFGSDTLADLNARAVPNTWEKDLPKRVARYIKRLKPVVFHIEIPTEEFNDLEVTTDSYVAEAFKIPERIKPEWIKGYTEFTFPFGHESELGQYFPLAKSANALLEQIKTVYLPVLILEDEEDA